MICNSFYLRIIVWLFGLIVSFGFSAIVSAGPCPNGAIAIWSLEESESPYMDYTEIESNDKTNNAVCQGQCPEQIGIEDGVVTHANRFDNSGLRVDNGTAFNWTDTDSFSIALWVRNSGAVGSDQVLIGRTDGSVSWNISLLGDGTIGFNLNDSTNTISLTSSKALSTPQSSLEARWHHVAVVRNGNNGMTQLFVDGQADGEPQTFTGGFTSDVYLAIGWSGDDNNPQDFTGDLDEVAVYQRALTPAEIRSQYYLARHYCGLYDHPVNIMPLGNSITYDYHRGTDNRPIGERGAYRYPLWQSLSGNNYMFDFVGNREAGNNLDTAFDPHNAGFPGITNVQLLTLLQRSYNEREGHFEGVDSDTDYLETHLSDVILLHIGTNGVANGDSNATQVADILDHIDGYSTNVTVAVARIIHTTGDFGNGEETPGNNTNLYNNDVEQMVDRRIADGDKLLKVDMEDGAGINYSEEADMEDDLHPNAMGYEKMAAQWYASLQELMPQVELPQITSEAVIQAEAGQEYQYQVEASGTPPPEFTLLDAPDGMTIDDTGLITWTASDTVGRSVYVNLEAKNIDPADAAWARVATQNFSISIVPKDDDGDNDDSSGGGCFIQSMVPGSHAQSVLGLVFGVLLLGRIVWKYGSNKAAVG